MMNDTLSTWLGHAACTAYEAIAMITDPNPEDPVSCPYTAPSISESALVGSFVLAVVGCVAGLALHSEWNKPYDENADPFKGVHEL